MKPSGPGQSPRLLSEVVPELEKLKIGHAVIGALAASFHGVVRSSLDADAVISTHGDPGLIEALISLLRARGWTVQRRVGGIDDPIDSVILITDGFQNRVDLLTGIRGMPADSLSRTVAAPILGATFRIIGAEDFVAMKLMAGGPKDLQDALGVLKVSGDQIDRALLQRLAARYGPDVAKRLRELTDRASPGESDPR